MLPEAKHLPTGFAQFSRDTPVASFVASEFRIPVTGVAAGLAAMHMATVPKAAVHKYGNPHGSEYEVGLSKKHLMAAPA